MKKYLLLIVMLVLVFSFGCEEAAKALSTTISGNVSVDGSPVVGGIVLLLDYDPTSIPDGLPLSNGMITGVNGNYIIVQVDIGTHMVIAIDDVDGSLTYSDGDRVGYYGTPDPLTGLTLPTPIEITELGEDVENIDITDMLELP